MMFLQKHLIEFLLTTLITLPILNCRKLQEEEVSRWAKGFGEELWKLGKATTKIEEIKQKYFHSNARVEEKDLTELLSEVVKDIERMMDRKMDAIRCIGNEAELAAERTVYNGPNYQYYSSKYSNRNVSQLPDSLQSNQNMYLNMSLNEDSHFYNLPVDISRSSVHVPTNIHDKHEEAAFAIQWSEELDKVFVKNYKSDPALSWQYFGSSSGIMRHFPAKKWPKIKNDQFDCRIRTWFIEAATCTKDVVILVDNSGSMDGMGRHIAALTVNNILDTFSNNDYINVLYYNVTANYTIPCFKNMLVQATPENIDLFKQSIKDLKPMGKTKLSKALETAFNLLARSRERRGCVDTDDSINENNITCSQAIMVITDGISKNLSDVVLKNNYLQDGSTIPVRLFTYLIGKEVTNVDEILWMSCFNRGYYSHVQALEQVQVSVLKYINVIARPLVLQDKQRPISWTHAYADLTYDDKKDFQIDAPYRLLTSAAVPVFDTKRNKNNKTRVAELLGVAGTDVPIEDIEKLTLPYKLGVNAYAFIVSNNGYVLMHRDFRPAFKGRLRKNYNSIDLTEVEQFDKDLPPRVTDEVLLALRNDIVNSSHGSMTDIPIKYHYDEMRRITKEKYDYYYSPVKDTPFSLAFAVPDGYGHYSLNVGDEIMENRHTGAKIIDFFEGFKWKIHPKWVYCKYHYLENHDNFLSPEEEIKAFLKIMYKDDFKWEKQYEKDEKEDLKKIECGRQTHGDDDYYCDRQLVQRLVYDAKNTMEAFKGWANQTGESQIFDNFDVTLRFIATMSGLTSWEYRNDDLKPPGIEFGDLHPKAIDETWYKSAVIQHEYDPESFVYSVPLDRELGENLVVTGSYAIFPKDENGVEAPACVVGFEFSHQKLKEKFRDFTTKLSNQCPDCKACFDGLSCYLIDNNGYILVSDDDKGDKLIGQFFGTIEQDIMDSLIKETIFEKVTIYDYQAICDMRDDVKSNNANRFSNPISYLKLFVNWCMTRIAWLAIEINLHNLLAPFYSYAQDLNVTDEPPWSKLLQNFGIPTSEEEDEEEYDDDEEDEYIPEDEEGKNFYDCEQERDLYVLQQKLFLRDFPGEIVNASRPYYIKRIPYSNLILIAINSTIPRPKSSNVYLAQPQKIIYDNDLDYACQKSELNKLPRRRLTGCFDEHPLEREIIACGRATTQKINYVTVIISLLLLSRYNLYVLM